MRVRWPRRSGTRTDHREWAVAVLGRWRTQASGSPSGLVPFAPLAPSELGQLDAGGVTGVVRAQPEQDHGALGARLGQVRRGVPGECEHRRGLEPDHDAALGTTGARRRIGQEVPLEGATDAQLDPGVINQPRADPGVSRPGPPDVLDRRAHADGLVQEALGGREVAHRSSRVGMPESGTAPEVVSRFDGTVDGTAADRRSGHRARTWYSGAGPVTESTRVIPLGVHSGPS